MNNSKFLKSLTMKNFRSWKDGFIEFTPGVNVITGENDVGKSGILGGLDWGVNNRPLGDDVRSHWGGNTDVLIEVENKLVGRHKSKGDNTYTLTHEDGKEDVFRPFRGREVPDAISQFLNIRPININSQFEPSFLLSMSPADVARYYNDAIHLDIIDRSISNINGVLREEKAQLKNQVQEEERLTGQLKEFKWLDEAEERLIKLEKGKTVISQKEKEFSDLSIMKLELESLEQELIEIQKITSHEKTTLTLIEKQKTIDRLAQEEEELSKYVIALNALIKQDSELQDRICFEGSVNNLIACINEIKTKDEEYRDLENYINKVRFLANEESRTQEKVRHESRANTLISLNSNINEKSREYSALEIYIEMLYLCEKEETKLQEKVRHEAQAVQLLDLDLLIENKSNLYNNLYDLRNILENLDKDLAQVTREREKLEKEFNDMMPNTCPLCGQSIKCEHKEKT